MAAQIAHRRSFPHRDTMRCSIFGIKGLATCSGKFLSGQTGRKLPSVKFHASQRNVVNYCC